MNYICDKNRLFVNRLCYKDCFTCNLDITSCGTVELSGLFLFVDLRISLTCKISDSNWDWLLRGYKNFYSTSKSIAYFKCHPDIDVPFLQSVGYLIHQEDGRSWNGTWFPQDMSYFYNPWIHSGRILNYCPSYSIDGNNCSTWVQK